MNVNADIVIIGGGPAGLSAALSAYNNGVENILIIEREKELGGILMQCIHHGFGMQLFNEELTGPEYAERFIKKIEDSNIRVMLNTCVIDLNQQHELVAINSNNGIVKIYAKAVILAMGCRERTREAITIPGTRPSGIFTAGLAQKYVNIDGYLPGEKIVILGSGDIGLIMARRLTLEGAKIQAVIEIQPFAGGLIRNVVQCLVDFDIPLLLEHTITFIHGKKRIEKVTVVKVDEKGSPIRGTEFEIKCDTLLLSVGLIPENELSEKANVVLDPLTGGPIVDEFRQTTVPGIFACGNVVHVHDLVDLVSWEGELAGASAAKYIRGKLRKQPKVNVIPYRGLKYVLPQRITTTQGVRFFTRVQRPQENVSLRFGEVKTIKKRCVVPSEVLITQLSKEQLACYPTKEILVELE